MEEDATSGIEQRTEMIMINIISSDRYMYSVRSSVRSKVGEFKDLLAQISRISSKYQRLLYRGEILKDDRTLDSYGLQAHHTIHFEIFLPFAGTITIPPSNTTTGGLGFQGLDRPTGGMPDSCQLLSLMMQTLLSRPLIMDHIVGQNPQLQSIFDSNPQLRDMIQDPEVVRQLTSPQMMQQLMGILQPGATGLQSLLISHEKSSTKGTITSYVWRADYGEGDPFPKLRTNSLYLNAFLQYEMR
ncbi:ubiquitin domain-containing protein DSK2a-like protein [Tanacetum coccineum]|uniref:Ubiquitin domain-containing protein DSK2a-like protein n=1 Tax=Tanacetum coccineum TaxID=301880 RepID=A0ABQ5GRL8_9ASTR